MSKNLGLTFWGLIVVLIDFKLNGFDILPDGIGYAVVAFGAVGLVEQSTHFFTASSMSAILTIAWLVGFFLPRDLAIAFGLIQLIFMCVLVWTLLGGIMDIAAARGRPDLVEQAAYRRLSFVILVGVSAALSLLADGSNRGGIIPVLAVCASIAFLVIAAMMLHTIHRARYELTA